MAFRFSLAAVLRLREIEEEREERRLGEVLAQISAAQEELKRIDRGILETLAAREGALAGGAPATALHASYAKGKLLEEHKLLQQERLARLEEQRLAQIAAYHAAHQRRELLSAMRQQQRESFASRQARQEQKSLDDLFILRFRRESSRL